MRVYSVEFRVVVSSELKDIFLSLVRLGIGHDGLNTNLNGSVGWLTVKALAERQGLSAVVLDGIDLATDSKHLTLNTQLKLEWIGGVLQNYEARYRQYENAIGSLASFYNQHGFRMMVLKGYACAMNWPRPEHRPCGDIDIWLFRKQKEADALLESSEFRVQSLGSVEKVQRIKVDTSHHHHTVFEWEGFTVENHYDFLNVHHHKSNVEMERILKELGDFKVESSEFRDESQLKECSDAGCRISSVTINGEKVYLPSANLHALFLLRHSMSNFASTGMQLRQLLDWAFFVEKHGQEIDWDWLEGQLDHFGMKRLYAVFNAICVDDLGFDVNLFPQVQFVPSLKERVLNDILNPEFSEKESGGFFSRAALKYRRWKANAWKHELCFSDSLWSAFWSGVKGHLMKPGMI